MNDLSGSRGEANFVWKCKNCKREASANIMGKPLAYEANSPPKRMKVIEVDCRGLELVEFKAEVCFFSFLTLPSSLDLIMVIFF